MNSIYTDFFHLSSADFTPPASVQRIWYYGSEWFLSGGGVDILEFGAGCSLVFTTENEE